MKLSYDIFKDEKTKTMVFLSRSFLKMENDTFQNDCFGIKTIVLKTILGVGGGGLEELNICPSREEKKSN